ncbi:PREDICTED: uncharacterized protein LOC109363229 [Lupinus angustifolius]|nr:PREDICTED: uncharacterized protein LOC109363229 [Lupinus angustifolius]
MTSMIPLQTIVPKNTINLSPLFNFSVVQFGVSTCVPCRMIQKNKNKSSVVVSAVGDVSADGTIYLVGGAIAVALIGTAFPIFFSRKDTCPECDGAGFVRKAGVTLRANAARKDQAQIVCATCNGLGKLNQIDKKK